MGVTSFVKALISLGATMLIAAGLLTGTLLADPPTKRSAKDKQKADEQTIFVTGSLIPQRVKLQPVTTKTVSPVRVIDRHEIDTTGRQTTAGALINEPSLRVIGR